MGATVKQPPVMQLPVGPPPAWHPLEIAKAKAMQWAQSAQQQLASVHKQHIAACAAVASIQHQRLGYGKPPPPPPPPLPYAMAASFLAPTAKYPTAFSVWGPARWKDNVTRSQPYRGSGGSSGSGGSYGGSAYPAPKVTLVARSDVARLLDPPALPPPPPAPPAPSAMAQQLPDPATAGPFYSDVQVVPGAPTHYKDRAFAPD